MKKKRMKKWMRLPLENDQPARSQVPLPAAEAVEDVAAGLEGVEA